MKKWQIYSAVGALGVTFIGALWFGHQQTTYNDYYRDKIAEIQIPNRIQKQEVLSQVDSNLWKKQVMEGIDLYLKDALPDYQGRKEGALFLSTLFPAPTDKPIQSRSEWVKYYKSYTYQFSQFQLISAPSKNKDGEAMIRLDWIKYKGKTSSWQQAPYINIQFNDKGYITGGNYYANQKG